MAYEFTAASSRYLLTSSSPIQTPPLTICAWFRPASLTTSTAIAACAQLNTNNRTLLFLDATGAVRAFADYGGQGSSTTTNTTSTNIWAHAAGVFASNSSRTAFLDGIAATPSTNTLTGTPSFNYIAAGSQFAGGSFRSFFNGQIAEVGIWDAALTAAEIASLARGMTCDKIRPQNLKFYAPLVRDLIDAKGGLILTNNNGATVANHPRIYA